MDGIHIVPLGCTHPSTGGEHHGNRFDSRKLDFLNGLGFPAFDDQGSALVAEFLRIFFELGFD